MSGLLNAGMLQNAMGHVLTYCTTLRADEPSSSVSARSSLSPNSFVLAMSDIHDSVCEGLRRLRGGVRSGRERTGFSILTYGKPARICASHGSSAVTASIARENVVDACLRVLEVVASHQDGIRLLEVQPPPPPPPPPPAAVLFITGEESPGVIDKHLRHAQLTGQALQRKATPNQRRPAET